MSSSVQQVPGIKRTDLQRHDLSVRGREVIQHRVEISPEAPFVRHKHPGEEIIYVLEGSLEYQVDGDEPKTVNAGEVLFVPADTVHAVRNAASGNAAELATYRAEQHDQRRGARDEAGGGSHADQPLPGDRAGHVVAVTV